MPVRNALLLCLLVLAGCATGPPEPESPVAVTPEKIVVAELEPPAPLPPPDDLWERIRRQLRFHTLHNDDIARARDHYLRQGRYLALIEPRARRYLYYLVDEVERRGLPVELALLPLVESALDPFAVSPQRAAGLWQIMPATADHLGVRRDWWFDGRLDVRASTHTALDYLEKLHADFDGDWLLALAAYNAGENRVKRLIRQRRQVSMQADFWSLPLPRETRRYVPRLIALSTLIAFDEALEFGLPVIPNAPGFVAIDTGGQIEMLRAAELSGISLQELRRYNPGHLRWASLPDAEQQLLVPPAAAAALQSGLASLGPGERVTWQHYRIRRGDSLIAIAGRFDTEVALLREVNNVRGAFIRAGDTLMIPDNRAWRESLALSRQERGSTRRGYRVRSGDSLYTIAMRFDVTIDDLITWNKLNPRDYLQPGQSLTLYVDGG